MSDSETRQGSNLPALLGLVVAILLWLAADDFRSRLPLLQQQIASAERLAQRGPNPSLDEARQAADAARKRRAEIENHLRAEESVQMSRARTGFELRRHCEAAGAQNCAVRLAEESRSAGLSPAGTAAAPNTPYNAAAAGPRTPAAQTLEALGITKSRAVITGGFQRKELDQLTERLLSDPQAHWRINGVTVRGTTFELDVERQLLASAPSVAKP